MSSAMVPIRHACFSCSIRIKDPRDIQHLKYLERQVSGCVPAARTRVVYHARISYSDEYPTIVVYAFVIERETEHMLFLSGGTRIYKNLKRNRKYAYTADEAVNAAISRARNYLSYSVHRLKVIRQTLELLTKPCKLDDSLYGIYYDLKNADNTIHAVEELMDELGISHVDPRYIHFDEKKVPLYDGQD